MSLPMLVNGAECGPSNPLQTLSKRFDQDRGLQQDHFGTSRGGSSRETFRTNTGGPVPDQDAARFFSSNSNTAPQIGPAAFDLSTLHTSLPHIQSLAQPQLQQPQPAPLAAWASDFMQQVPSTTAQIITSRPEIQVHQEPSAVMQTNAIGMQWNPTFSGPRLNSMPIFMPQNYMQVPVQKPQIHIDQSAWDQEFLSQAHSLASTSVVPLQEIQQNHQVAPQDADDLARTAGLLVDSVRNEQNPKFQNSQFLGLMRQLRDRMVVVEGNQMVDRDTSAAQHTQFDIKGKGKAIDFRSPQLDTRSDYGALHSGVITSDNQRDILAQERSDGVLEDENDAYFRKENEEFTRYWNDFYKQREPGESSTSQPQGLWDDMQEQWDKFESTSTGIKPVPNYQFQENNPYLHGRSSTRHHMMHLTARESLYENVLELEAAVQRNSSDANSWFELGIKQQENEREQKAIVALQRAIDLDPSHLPTWLALAISYTNEGNRLGTYDSINEWVKRNGKYETVVRRFNAEKPENPSASTSERFGNLIQCLVSMARSDISGGVDADIQVALAVLLNTNEDYAKAQDCFQAALAVRPDDWLLYNRVGATMANNGNAEDAIQYYYRALELNPAYIRARFNLGISCINLRRYEEAAQHILDALVLQDSDLVPDASGMNEARGVTSNALWDTLKTTCLHMQRIDLATLCDRQDVDAFRDSFYM